jgi:hypothetical protein
MLFSKSRPLPATSGATERLAPAPQVVSVVQDTDTALLDLRSERYFTLNEVGTRIWALLGEGTEVAMIIELLAEEYDAPIGAIEEDTRALLAGMRKAGLVRPA